MAWGAQESFEDKEDNLPWPPDIVLELVLGLYSRAVKQWVSRKYLTECTESYDRDRETLVPCFEEFYGTVIRVIPFKREDSFNALDLGAGTGLLAALVGQEFPNALITLTDLSDDLPPRTSPPSKLDLGPLEVHSPEQNRVLVTWEVWPPAPEADRPRRCEAVSGCTPFATSRLAPLLPTTCRRSLH